MLCECGSYTYVCITRMAVIKVTNDSSRKMVAEYITGVENWGAGGPWPPLHRPRFWGIDYSYRITSVRILWVWGHKNDTIYASVWSDNYLKSQMTSSTTYIWQWHYHNDSWRNATYRAARPDRVELWRWVWSLCSLFVQCVLLVVKFELQSSEFCGLLASLNNLTTRMLIIFTSYVKTSWSWAMVSNTSDTHNSLLIVLHEVEPLFHSQYRGRVETFNANNYYCR